MVSKERRRRGYLVGIAIFVIHFIIDSAAFLTTIDNSYYSVTPSLQLHSKSNLHRFQVSSRAERDIFLCRSSKDIDNETEDRNIDCDEYNDKNDISNNQNNDLSNDQNNDFSFFDEATIYVRAGSGGQGASTYKRAKKGADGIPDGGSGGLGGNVVLQIDYSLNTLAGLNKKALRPNAFGGGGSAASSKRSAKGGRQSVTSFRAEDGFAGGRMYNNGRAGEDCIVRVPPGTVVNFEKEMILDNDFENDTKDDKHETNDEVKYIICQPELGTLTPDNPTLIVAKGGTGGEGTATLKGKKKGATRKGPVGGERHRLRLTLKVVADVALVGVPNAGKSTFLSSVTSAKPRIADYPFTTVVPNLGVWIPGTTAKSFNKDKSNHAELGRAAGSTGLILCDVPGLIKGAADGKGLGHAFLRHVERCCVILHLIDCTSQDPVFDFEMVNKELKKYGTGSLGDMPQVVVVNKVDTWEQDEENSKSRKDDLERRLKAAMGHTRLMWVSAKGCDGLDPLMSRMASYVQQVKGDTKETV